MTNGREKRVKYTEMRINYTDTIRCGYTGVGNLHIKQDDREQLLLLTRENGGNGDIGRVRRN